MILAKFDFVLLLFLFLLSLVVTTYVYQVTRCWWGYLIFIMVNVYFFFFVGSIFVQTLIINFFTSYGCICYRPTVAIILNLQEKVLATNWLTDQLLSIYVTEHNGYYPLNEFNFVLGININIFSITSDQFIVFLLWPTLAVYLVIFICRLTRVKLQVLLSDDWLTRYFVCVCLSAQTVIVGLTLGIFYSTFFLDLSNSTHLLSTKLYYIEVMLHQYDFADQTQWMLTQWVEYRPYFTEVEEYYQLLCYDLLWWRGTLIFWLCYYFLIGIHYFTYIRCGETR